MGIVTKNVPIGHPDFGKAFPCRCKTGQGMVQQRLDRLFASSGLNKSQYNRYTLADYHQGAPAGLDVAVQAADRWACQARLSYEDLGINPPIDLPIDTQRSGLVFYGPTGTGKTCLASAAFRERLIARGQSGLIVEYSRVMAEIQGQYSDEENQSEAMIQQLIDAPLLMLDDLGNPDMDRAETPDKKRILFRVVDGRYIEDRPLLITTNLSPDSVYAQLGERIGDRLVERCVWVPMDQAWLRGGHA